MFTQTRFRLVRTFTQRSRHKALNVFLVLATVLSTFSPLASTPVVLAASGINKTIGFVGQLKTPTGANVVDGALNMYFAILKSGNAIWYQEYTNTTTGQPNSQVSVVNSNFSVELGAVPGNLLPVAQLHDDDLTIAVRIGTDGTMTPNLPITTAVQALYADTLDGIDSTGFIQTNQAASVSSLTASGAASFNSTLTATQGVAIPLGTPAVITNTLYNVGGSLFFNGAAVGGGVGTSVAIGNSENIAYQIKEAGNNFFLINTNGDSITFGNAATNPTYSFLGTGGLSITGSTTATGVSTTFLQNSGATALQGATNISSTLNVGGLSTLSGGVVAVGSSTFVNTTTFANGLYIGSSTPASTGNALYAVGTSLYWNGLAVIGSGAVATSISTIGSTTVSGGLPTGLLFVDQNGKLGQNANITWNSTTNEFSVNGKMTLTGGLDPTYLQFAETSTST
ncbi:MAG TPA: hypothetical protein VEA59_03010, partial [Patescibacteria group bacterium]|nr:hypothetical protein [Patescibacteria group bacterium]